MKYDPAIHHRRSIRLPDYDYGQAGAYFVTICVQGRKCLLGEIVDASISVSHYGAIVEQVWHQIPQHFLPVTIDAAVIMPNHFHGIIVIADESLSVQQPHDLAPQQNSKKPTLGQIVAYFKYQSTKLINSARGMTGVKFWQCNYYEHIIRSEASLARLRTYIEQNPQKWQHDQLHSQNPSKW
ncbi:transposase [Oscillatoria sp. CS-180]|uniref:transposase n=1 Tax=Oscillatoria sp. CS-180 TaxID=3021720 RepID=UPI00232BE636|nr:transposase [Oscillatoria sp. CS-180]MDB9527144.1 transposase [Oscillatoria sp. CS-180]